MLTPSGVRWIYALVVATGLAGVPWLAVIELQRAVSIGTAEAWMLVGVMAVVAGLPVLMVLLVLVDWLRRALHRHSIVPVTGEKVP
ncbi:MAG: hypothetical protein JSR63_04380 [Proteobacteria bacterium]|nr:hypothetical protein [Pseudomonadota bacterium]MBS0217402.1 hypothetical protein [Pseudomonadota bacterium]